MDYNSVVRDFVHPTYVYGGAIAAVCTALVSVYTVPPMATEIANGNQQALHHAVYNAFLHPLRDFSSPRLWAANRLPWCWHQYNGRLNNRLLELHIKYGHTVRVAPNELSYASDTAWKTIYGQRSAEMSKDPVFSLHTPLVVSSKLKVTIQPHVH